MPNPLPLVPLVPLALLALVCSDNSIAADAAQQATPTAAAVKPDQRQYKSAPIKPSTTIGMNRSADSKPPAPAFDVARLDELIALELPALALSIIEQHQPQTTRFAPDWYRMERKRVSVLSLLERWNDLIARVDAALGENPDIALLPQELIDWFSTQRAIALLNSEQHDRALRALGRLIWSQAHYDRRVVFALWRRLVINAYLEQDNIEDAESAMLRYGHDYRDSDFALTDDWKFTRAGVLLRLGRYDEVMQLMQAQATPLEMQYYLLAQLRHDKGSAQQVAQQVEKQGAGAIVSKSDRWAWRYLVYEARLAEGKDKDITAALQQLLSVGRASHRLQRIVDVGPDDWWRRYLAKGDALGNRLQLLRGDDSAWYTKAQEMSKSSSDKAISLLVALALHSRELNHRQVAHAELVSILDRRNNSKDLLLQLYLYSDTIDDLDVLPVSARAALIDHALDKKDITQAARLMQSIDRVPAEHDPFVWRLRKARVLILEGAYADGEKVLFELFDNLPGMLPGMTGDADAAAESAGDGAGDSQGEDQDKVDIAQQADKLDRIMQVLFDLQSVQRHEAALELFRRVAELDLEFQLRRELYFWMAQSSQALSRYAEAAMNYLRSARMQDGSMNDQWALSSRLKAAEALVKAGLYDDAETLYRRLLKVTANESRKAMIQQEMQQIYLLRNASKATTEASAR